MDRRGVLVLDGGGQAALAVVRSLGKRGVPVTAGAASATAPALWSRYSDAAYRYPDPAAGGREFVAHLHAHLDANDYAVVFAVSDHLSALLSRHAESLASTGTVVAVEDWDRFQRAFDKATLFEHLTTVDVPCPETYAPESQAELDAVAERAPVPAVVKPRSKTQWADDWSGFEQHRVQPSDYAASAADLVETYWSVRDRLGPSADPPIVQEYVAGETTTTVALADEGTVRAHFQERRERTYPAAGGNSALLTPVDDERMLAYAKRVLASLDWSGPAMVEFIETATGDFACIEVNGRYWGSLPFAVACGVDFPWLHYRQLHGETVVGPSEYDIDHVQRRLLPEDVLWVGERIRHGDVRGAVPFLTDFVGTDHTFYDPDDPAATLASLLHSSLGAARHGVGRVADLVSTG